jgi:26S proteasome regulatory subunit N12
MSASDLASLVQSLEKGFQSNNFSALHPLLTRAKALLSASNLLNPSPQHVSPHLLQFALRAFEIGALTSIRQHDIAAFTNYFGYLQNYYSFEYGGNHEAELTGLNLLRLLAENKIAEFHIQLEIIDAGARSEVKESADVVFARGLEEWVMEGAYNRVWKAGEGKGVSVYQKFFIDVLMNTVRYD